MTTVVPTSVWNDSDNEETEEGFGFGDGDDDISPMKLSSGGEDDTPMPDQRNSVEKPDCDFGTQRDIFGGFDDPDDSESEDVGGFGFIDVPEDFDHDFDDNEVVEENISDEVLATEGTRPQLDDSENNNLEQQGDSSAEHVAARGAHVDTTDDTGDGVLRAGSDTDCDDSSAEVVSGQRNGWCKVKTVKKAMSAKQTRKAPWREMFLALTATGVLEMRTMPNDPTPAVTMEIPYGVLLFDPGTERFSLAYKNETYHFDAKTAPDATNWTLNLEKSKKLNRRKSSYGRSARASTGLLF
eukprot:m.1150810 g.1150810  ORF g.1150810 m.1150810 type:complete len:297 (+) comp24478_c1_seq7:334-1224(+)